MIADVKRMQEDGVKKIKESNNVAVDLIDDTANTGHLLLGDLLPIAFIGESSITLRLISLALIYHRLGLEAGILYILLMLYDYSYLYPYTIEDPKVK
jgi:hypothetical protein